MHDIILPFDKILNKLSLALLARHSFIRQADVQVDRKYSTLGLPPA